MLALVFNAAHKLLFHNSKPAFSPTCCCFVECCSDYWGSTLYGRMCLQNCDCATGYPVRVEIDFDLVWSAINFRWEASITIPGCATTLQVRVRCVPDPIDDFHIYWADDACVGDWDERQVDTTHCDTCDPFFFSIGSIPPASRYLGCCPDDTGTEPGWDVFVFCTPEARTCDP